MTPSRHPAETRHPIAGRSLALGAGAVLAASIVAGLPAGGSVCPLCRSLLGLRDRVADPGAVALTFDDGPHPEATPRLLEILAARDVRATFFLVGEQVKKRPALAAAIAAQGHEIGLHSYSHAALTWLTPQAMREELDRSAAAIGDTIGRVPDIFRPPRGVFTYSALAEVRRRGWQPVLWAVDGRDWRQSATAGSIYGRLARRLAGGDVVLLHDSDFYSSPRSWVDTLDAVPLLLDEISRRGLKMTTLGGLCRTTDRSCPDPM